MAVKSKTQLKTDVDATIIDGGDLLAHEDRPIRKDVIDSYEDFIASMTTVQRDAIVSPSTRLLIYNTTVGRYQYYDGSAWKDFGGITSGFSNLIVFIGDNIDMKSEASTVINPDFGFDLYPTEVGLIVEQADTVTGQPEFSFGVVGVSTSSILGDTTSTDLTANKDRQGYTSLVSQKAVDSLNIQVKTAATGTTLICKPYIIGFKLQ